MRRIGPATRGAGLGLPVRSRIVDVDPAQRIGEPIGIAFASHLAVADDIDPGELLIADRHQGRGLLRVAQPRLGDAPQLLRADARR